MNTSTIALIGYPNSGKTSFFNQLTKNRHYVGNWDGVTVDMHEGSFYSQPEIKVVDLPGLYSLTPLTDEEKITTKFLENLEANLIINVIDITQAHKELYLTLQLMNLGKPMILLFNKGDLISDSNDFPLRKIAETLNIPSFIVSSKTKTPSEDLSQYLTRTLHSLSIEDFFTGKQLPTVSIPDEKEPIQKIIRAIYPEKIANDIDEISLLLPCDRAYQKALKIIEHPENIDRKNLIVRESIKNILGNNEETLSTEIIQSRHSFLDSLIPLKNKEDDKSFSEKLDRFVLNKYLAFPLFIGIIWLVYYLAITSIGGRMVDWIGEDLFEGILQPFLVNLMTSFDIAEWMQTLITDSFIAGVGTVLSFTPQLFILFLLLAILEDSGYIVRVALIMDRLMRPFGLSGRSVIPFIISSGCSVPGIMAARTIKNTAQQKRTIILSPFIPCAAKIPIIALMVTLFFAKDSWIVPSIYSVCISAIAFSSLLMKKVNAHHEEESLLISTLPNYRCPSLKEIFTISFDKTKSFVYKAGTLIFLGCALISFLNQFNFTLHVVEPDESILATLGNFIAPIFSPLGFDHASSVIATITGFVAKENIVATLGILMTGSEDLEGSSLSAFSTIFTPMSAYSFLVFNMLCAPCFAAMGAMRKELGSFKGMAYALLFQTGISYLMSLALYQIGTYFELSVYTNVLVFLFGLWTSILILSWIPERKINNQK